MASENGFPLPRLARNSVARFFQGAELPFRAAGFLLARPGLWHLVFLPLVVNILLFAVLLYWGFTGFRGMVEGWTEQLAAWYLGWLVWILKTLFWIVALIVVYFVFTPLALVVSAPFNDRLAERVERIAGFAMPGDGRSVLRFIASEVVFVLASECVRMAVCIAVFILLLPLLVVPPLYAAAGFYWAARCGALEFISYAADRRHVGFGGKWEILRENYMLTLGFGLATVLLLMIPFLNVFVVPVSAVAGTFLFGLARR
ncbi:EI24 domain-containing protein [Candidatus Sumerlaeota bacterium]|nr:EI24 domain-containing protein [Candidatus Sumerlaeota bacterium]